MTLLLETAKDSFDILLQVGAGTGLLYLLRWFWWRITAWCEVVAMISSFGISIFWLVLKRWPHAAASLFGDRREWFTSTHVELLLTVAFTTVCWTLAAYLGPQTDRRTLIAFYQKVRPFGPGWAPIRRWAKAAGLPQVEAAGDNIPLALLGWVSGCTVIWSGLFVVGNVLYARYGYAAALSAIFVASGAVLVRVVNRLWK